MSNTNDSRIVLQRLKDIDNEQDRDTATLGVQITLEGNLGHLRSIKDTEVNWLQLSAIVTLPAIGYLMGVSDDNFLLKLGWPILVVMLLYLVFTGWVQYVLLRERISYYSVLRSVVRAQNLLGLFDIKFLSPHFAGSAFPKGFGPNPEQNGTQPQSSFLRRQLYTVIAYAGVVFAAAFRQWSMSPWFMGFAVTCLGLDLAWLGCIFCRDNRLLIAHTAAEQGCAGCDPTWFPSSQGTDEAPPS